MKNFIELHSGRSLEIKTSKHADHLVTTVACVNITIDDGVKIVEWLPYSDYSRRVIVTPCPRVSDRLILAQQCKALAYHDELIAECAAFYAKSPGSTFAFKTLN